MLNAAPAPSPVWPQDFGGFLDLLHQVSAADYVCLHAGSWLLVEADGSRIPVSVIGTTARGTRLALSIVGADSLEAAMLRGVKPARPLITYEELAEAWSWYTCGAASTDRLNCIFAKFAWIEIGPEDAIWATSAAVC